MIKNFVPRPYDGVNILPNYAANVRVFTLIGSISGDYKITLAKLTVGDSISKGNSLSHALFESFTDHGDRAKTSRTRVNGYDGEFIAVKTAMSETGIEFNPTLPCSSEEVLRALGDWIVANNSEIRSFSIVSQTCH